MHHQERFLRLDSFLTQYRELWQLRPFTHTEIPWARQWPELAHWLKGLEDDHVTRLDEDTDALVDTLISFIPDAQHARLLTRIPASRRVPLHDDERMSYRVPGRKWQQVQAFVEALPRHPLPILEWCAGKGHLGRLAGIAMASPVESLELDAAFCAEGQQLAQRQGADQRLRQVDVMETGSDYLRSSQQVLALHACGDLHMHLLHEASRRHVQILHISPCCYHRTQEDIYRPLSPQAQQSNLRLNRQDRQLAVQETVTAGQKVRGLRDRETSWRLGFDCLQRELLGSDSYLPLPSLQKSLLNGSFREFCNWAAECKQLALPTALDYASFEQKGIERCRLVRRIELVGHLFRRPLELWLVLDRILFLESQGYHVVLVEFCQRHLTPRNLLIQASRYTPLQLPTH